MNMVGANGIKRNIAAKSIFFKLSTCFIILLIAYGCAGNKPAIINAAASGDINTVKKLQDEGRNINEADSNGATPLMHAIWGSKSDLAKYLIQSGADIKVENKQGYNAFIYAVNYGDFEIIKLLLAKGANINSKDNWENTALMHTILSGRSDVAKYLIESGADIKAKNKKGYDALIHAVDYENYEIIKLLLDKGADVNSKDNRNITPILHASLSKNDKIVLLLAKRGADLSVKDGEGYTPLAWASYYEKKELVAELKKVMADARKDMFSAKIVFIRDSFLVAAGGVSVYINEELISNLSRNSTDYADINPGKCTMVIKGGKLEGDHVKSFDAVSGQTYYFLVTRRVGNVVAGFAGAIGLVVESQIQGEKAGAFEIIQLEESVAKEKIKELLKTSK